MRCFTSLILPSERDFARCWWWGFERSSLTNVCTGEDECCPGLQSTWVPGPLFLAQQQGVGNGGANWTSFPGSLLLGVVLYIQVLIIPSLFLPRFLLTTHQSYTEVRGVGGVGWGNGVGNEGDHCWPYITTELMFITRINSHSFVLLLSFLYVCMPKPSHAFLIQ